MLSDDLFGRIALDALGAEIPTAYQSLGIEHVDGIVGDASHQQTELRFAAIGRRDLSQPRFTLPARGLLCRPFGDVGALDEDTGDHSVLVLDRLINEVDQMLARWNVRAGLERNSRAEGRISFSRRENIVEEFE